MAKTLAQINQQIDKLKREAESLKAKEVAGVVERIRSAIEHYGLTAADLFGTQAVRRTRAKPAAGKRKPSVIKYRDDKGHAWTGVGKRPNWFKEAIASGKTAEDLLVK